MHPTGFGKYEVVELIGEGGFGRVFKGLDPDLKRPVAIKTCSLREPEMRERFFREAEIAARLRHPNITTVYDFGREGDEPYLVQEYLTGEDLDDVIREGRPISLSTKVEYLVRVGEGLVHAHTNGVVHRDIKPANIRILDDGQVRIMDFGIARLVEETQRFTQAGMSIGTAGYLSPEQLQGLEVDHRSDIFSFGVLAYELVLNQSPFKGESISALFYAIAHEEPASVREVWPDCPPELAACIGRCLEKDRDARYPDFSEVIRDLKVALNAFGGAGGDDAYLAGVAMGGSGVGTAPSPGASATTAFGGGGAPDTVAGDPSSAGPKPSGPAGPKAAGVAGPGPLAGGERAPDAATTGAGKGGRKKWLLPLWGVLGVALVVALFEVVRLPGRGESAPGGGDEVKSVLDEDPGVQTEIPTGDATPGAEAGVSPTDAAGPGETGESVDVTDPGAGGGEIGGVAPDPESGATDTDVTGAAAGAGGQTVAPAADPPEAEVAPVPFSGSATLVLFWTVGGDPGSVTTAENAFLEELDRRRLQVVEAGLLAGIHGDAASVAMAQGMDAGAIAQLGRTYDAEVVVVGSLRTEAAPSAGRFFTGRAVLDVRSYRASSAELLGSETYQVGSANTPGELGPSQLAAETAAAQEVGRRAAAAIAQEFRGILPQRR